jgi:putative FmdB family regulatory protein
VVFIVPRNKKRRLRGVPIYEYECESCHQRVEVIQKFSDKPLKKCTQCGGSLHKVLSPPALVFKGAGWYVNDYAKPERAKAQQAEKNGGSNGSKAVETATSAPSKSTASKTKE